MEKTNRYFVPKSNRILTFIDDSIRFVSTLVQSFSILFFIFFPPAPTLQLRRPFEHFPKRLRSDISIFRHRPPVLLVRNDLCQPLGNRIRFYHCRPFAFYAMSNGLCLCLPPDPWTRSMLGRVTTGDHGRVTYEFFRGNRYVGFTLISRCFGESFATPRLSLTRSSISVVMLTMIAKMN